MSRGRAAEPHKKLLEIGWRELVGLPDLGVPAIRAKVDTGARTSALHAIDLHIEKNGKATWAEFHIPQHGVPRSRRCRAPLIDQRPIKNTSGVPEHRHVIQTTLVLGRRHWHIEVSLADRESMTFDLILGRTAVRNHGLVVNPGRSFLVGAPTDLRVPTSD